MLNEVILVGRLTKNCEVRKTTSGLSVCSFTLAVTEGKSDTEFIDCVAWRGNADFLGQYGKKGDIYAVKGRLAKDKRDPEHPDRYPSTKVQCNAVTAIAQAKREPKQEEEPKYPEYEKWNTPVDVTDDELPF